MLAGVNNDVFDPRPRKSMRDWCKLYELRTSSYD